LEIHDPPGLQNDSLSGLGIPSFSGPFELDFEFAEARDQHLIASFKGLLDDFKGGVHEFGGALLGHLRVTELREEKLLFVLLGFLEANRFHHTLRQVLFGQRHRSLALEKGLNSD
jgi:hypothetical protein